MPIKEPNKAGAFRIEQTLETLNLYKKNFDENINIWKGIGNPCGLSEEELTTLNFLYDLYFDELNQQWYGKRLSTNIEDGGASVPLVNYVGQSYKYTWVKLYIIKTNISTIDSYCFNTSTPTQKLDSLINLYDDGTNYWYLGNQYEVTITLSTGTWEDKAGNSFTVSDIIESSVTNSGNIIQTNTPTFANYEKQTFPLSKIQWEFDWTGSTDSNHRINSVIFRTNKDLSYNGYKFGVFQYSSDGNIWYDCLELIGPYTKDTDYVLYFKNEKGLNKNESVKYLRWYPQSFPNNSEIYDASGVLEFSFDSLTYTSDSNCEWQPINEPTWYYRHTIDPFDYYGGNTYTWTIPGGVAAGLPYEGYYQIDVFVTMQDYALQDPGPPPVYIRNSTTDPDTLTAKGTGDGSAITIDMSGHILVPVGETKWYNNSLQGSCIVKVTGDLCSNRYIEVVYNAGPAGTTNISCGGGYVHIEYLGNQELDKCINPI